MKKLLCGLFAITLPPVLVAAFAYSGYLIDQNRELAATIVVIAAGLAVWGVASYAVYRGTQL